MPMTGPKSQRLPERVSHSTSPENPPKKRKRLTNPLMENKIRAEEAGLWFKDGNVILVGDSTPFKVHRSILCQKSVIFEDMFSLPQPPPSETELMGELPVVNLPDSWSDLKYMLLGMYYGQKYLGHQKAVAFDMLSALLRLGSKYEITELREEAVTRLKLCFPRCLGSFNNSFTQRDIYTAYLDCSPDVIEMETTDVLEVINLARAHDIPDILPPAFYLCSTLSPWEIVPVDAWEDSSCILLSPMDLRRLLDGKNSLIQDDTAFLLHLRNGFEPNKKTCKRSCYRRFNLAFTSNSDYPPEPGTFLIHTFWIKYVLPDKDFCVDCIKSFTQEVNRYRKKIWRNLGDQFTSNSSLLLNP